MIKVVNNETGKEETIICGCASGIIAGETGVTIFEGIEGENSVESLLNAVGQINLALIKVLVNDFDVPFEDAAGMINVMTTQLWAYETFGCEEETTH